MAGSRGSTDSATPRYSEQFPAVGAKMIQKEIPNVSTKRYPTTRKQRKKPDDDAEGSGLFDLIGAAAGGHHFALLSFRNILGVTVALYILNQAHCLPKPLSAVVTKCLFWPSLPITVSKRIGKWTTQIDDTVLLGGAPFGFVHIPERLYRDYGVRGVVNLCDEYEGPIKKYEELGMRQIRLKTVDHFVPSVDDLKSAVAFIQELESEGKRVYVHCRAGHGRSAAAVFAWLLYQDPDADPEELNMELRKLRSVRKTLWKQPSIKEFHSWVKSGGSFGSQYKRRYPNLRKILGLNEFNSYDEAQKDIDFSNVEEMSASDEISYDVLEDEVVEGMGGSLDDMETYEHDFDQERHGIEFDDESTSSENDGGYTELWRDNSEPE